MIYDNKKYHINCCAPIHFLLSCILNTSININKLINTVEKNNNLTSNLSDKKSHVV